MKASANDRSRLAFRGSRPSGRPQVGDAARRGRIIAALPKKEHDQPEWRAAMGALLLVVERGGPTMFARIGIMRALNAGRPGPELEPRRTRAKAYRITK